MRLMRGDNTDQPAREMYHATPIPGRGGYEKFPDPRHDAPLHLMAGREVEADPLRHRSRMSLVHASVISGRPGYDYSNPYAFLTRLYLNKPTLVTSYGGGSQSAQGIAVNVAAGNAAIKKTW